MGFLNGNYQAIYVFRYADMQCQRKHLEELLSPDNKGMPYGVVKHVRHWPKTVPLAIFSEDVNCFFKISSIKLEAKSSFD